MTRRLVLVDGSVDVGGNKGAAAGVSAGSGMEEAPTGWDGMRGEDPAGKSGEAWGAYGLTISGAGLETYVDATVQMAMGIPWQAYRVHRPPAGKAGSVLGAGGVRGDVTNDGVVNIEDALVVATYGIDPTIVAPNGGDLSLGDVNGDGRINITDALMIATYGVNPSNSALPAGLRQSTGPVAGDTLMVELLDGVPMEFVRVPAGAFPMGTSAMEQQALEELGVLSMSREACDHVKERLGCLELRATWRPAA